MTEPAQMMLNDDILNADGIRAKDAIMCYFTW